MALLAGSFVLISNPAEVRHDRDAQARGDPGFRSPSRSAVDAVRCPIEVRQGLIERNAGVPELKQLLEFLHAEPSLPDNGPKRAWFEIAAEVDRDCDGSRRIFGERHQVMTADDPIDHESGAPEGSNDALAVQRRQLAVGHARPRLLLGGFQAARRKGWVAPERSDIPALRGSLPRHWRGLPVPCRLRSRPPAGPEPGR